MRLLGGENAAAGQQSISAASALVEVCGSVGVASCGSGYTYCLQRLEACVCGLVSRPSAVSISTHLLFIKKILAFCRQGEVACNDLFEALGSQLASLFKATYSLLKVRSLLVLIVMNLFLLLCRIAWIPLSLSKVWCTVTWVPC